MTFSSLLPCGIQDGGTPNQLEASWNLSLDWSLGDLLPFLSQLNKVLLISLVLNARCAPNDDFSKIIYMAILILSLHLSKQIIMLHF